MEKADHFKLYTKEDHEKEFRAFFSTKDEIDYHRLKDKMASAGEPKVKKKPNKGNKG